MTLLVDKSISVKSAFSSIATIHCYIAHHMLLQAYGLHTSSQYDKKMTNLQLRQSIKVSSQDDHSCALLDIPKDISPNALVKENMKNYETCHLVWTRLKYLYFEIMETLFTSL
ncbi:hypothetical protein CDAR_618191 [Caerostris darwini]|uniref:Uncharacterized protein n=1 Tax=Caerostris darwini TaxID=1538125 RepID=A0AAV4U8T1_9ARAC|nr:hypothetical protein CDAR_618191 [Caerostris darwini]